MYSVYSFRSSKRIEPCGMDQNESVETIRKDVFLPEVVADETDMQDESGDKCNNADDGSASDIEESSAHRHDVLSDVEEGDSYGHGLSQCSEIGTMVEAEEGTVTARISSEGPDLEDQHPTAQSQEYQKETMQQSYTTLGSILSITTDEVPLPQHRQASMRRKSSGTVSDERRQKHFIEFGLAWMFVILLLAFVCFLVYQFTGSKGGDGAAQGGERSR